LGYAQQKSWAQRLPAESRQAGFQLYLFTQGGCLFLEEPSIVNAFSKKHAASIARPLPKVYEYFNSAVLPNGHAFCTLGP